MLSNCPNIWIYPFAPFAPHSPSCNIPESLPFASNHHLYFLTIYPQTKALDFHCYNASEAFPHCQLSRLCHRRIFRRNLFIQTDILMRILRYTGWTNLVIECIPVDLLSACLPSHPFLLLHSQCNIYTSLSAFQRIFLSAFSLRELLSISLIVLLFRMNIALKTIFLTWHISQTVLCVLQSIVPGFFGRAVKIDSSICSGTSWESYMWLAISVILSNSKSPKASISSNVILSFLHLFHLWLFLFSVAQSSASSLLVFLSYKSVM